MDNAIIEIAVGALGVTEDEARNFNKPVPEIDGWYFWSPTRGGKALLINKSHERLIAPSSISFDAHMSEFKKGRRN